MGVTGFVVEEVEVEDVLAVAAGVVVGGIRRLGV